MLQPTRARNVSAFGFQSSPGPKAGCYARSGRRNTCGTSGFNPHPARRPGATGEAPLGGPLEEVSILTRPEGRVLRLRYRPSCEAPPRFNPHPARRPGATRHRLAVQSVAVVSILTRPEGRVLRGVPDVRPLVDRVSILTRPEGRVLHDDKTRGSVVVVVFQSSPGPKAGCYHTRSMYDSSYSRVSILTRPEGRVLLADVSFFDMPDDVSILTRPEGRVLLWADADPMAIWLFQSSPGPKAGCYDVVCYQYESAALFQSSPGPKAGCYRRGVRLCVHSDAFQSSPGPKAGCYGRRRQHRVAGIAVSILTRPEGRVLRVAVILRDGLHPLFQSSPGPKAGCYASRSASSRSVRSVSILTRPEGRVLHEQGAGHGRLRVVSILTRPEGRVLQRGGWSSSAFRAVSILTRPEGRVLPSIREEGSPFS